MRYSELYKERNKENLEHHFQKFPKAIELLLKNAEDEISPLILRTKSDLPIHDQYEEADNIGRRLFDPNLDILTTPNHDLMYDIRRCLFPNEENRKYMLKNLKFKKISPPSEEMKDEFFETLRNLTADCVTFCLEEFKKDIIKEKENAKPTSFAERLKKRQLPRTIPEVDEELEKDSSWVSRAAADSDHEEKGK